jgi:hypothetical protein
MINKIKQIIFSFISRFNFFKYDPETQLVLLSKVLSRNNIDKKVIKSINEVEFKVFSQWGEDGIIDWLVNSIPTLPKTFIEFGVETYTESNTRLLLLNHNWSGLVIDGSLQNIQNIKKQNIYWRHNLNAIHAFIDVDNINELFSISNFGTQIGILSIDIDGNDYWVWDKIQITKPVIVICEYNAVFGDLNPITIPYNSEFQRTNYSDTNLYFGASIQALINLAEKKGYEFIGTNSHGCNAFFIDKNYSHNITDKISDKYIFPSKFREARNAKNELLYINGPDRLKLISDLDIYDLDLNKVVKINTLTNSYSNFWINDEKRRF